jgi:hypothetical protein
MGFDKLLIILVLSMFFTELDTLDVTFLIEFATFVVAFFTFVIGASIKDEIVVNGGEFDAFVFRLILIDISIEYLVGDLYKRS